MIIIPYGYLYLTTNTVNNKKYVEIRHTSTYDEHYLGSGKYLKQDIKLYGRHSFTNEIIAWYDSEKELFEAEKEFIKLNNCVNSPDWYNAVGGGSGNFNRCNTPEATQKALDGRWNKTTDELNEISHRQAKTLKRTLANWSDEERKHHKQQTSIGTKNGIKQARLNETKEQAEQRHRNYSNAQSKSTKGRHWYTNGIDNKQQYTCPEGYWPGRTIQSKR